MLFLRMALSWDKKDGRELRIHENADELSTDLAEYIAELSEASVKERGVFAIALSGGSLISLMRKLCEAPFNKTVEWAKWHIFWADERVVAKSHIDSNYKLLKDNLLAKVPTVPSHVHSINDSVTAEQAAEDYEFVIRQLVRTRVIDPPPERITFTLPVINSASDVAVVVTGGSKAEAVHLAIDDIEPDCPVLPARMVRPTEGKLVWFLDQAAASKLDGAKFSE
ncbi:putative 6-phosphogluconolactonase 1 [Abeliophyllum distichum]|uniref:6-phosphogluconolactonase 1 n=1 Tax=Abeliophyllum distichum TaxID=126358 RepID=A0ABD1U2M8_9LAMI